MDFHNRQYDPQIGRFLSVDPLAAETEYQSTYAGMDNNPASVVDPLGLRGSDYTTGFLITANADVIWRTEGGKYNGPSAGREDEINGGMIIHDLIIQGMHDRMIAAAYRDAIGLYTAVGIGGVISNGLGAAGGGGGENVDDNVSAGDSPNDEEPVKFLNDENKILNDVFDNISYKEGDNVFYVMGHGNRDLIEDNSGAQEVKLWNAKDFDEAMSAKSPEYKAAIEGNKPFTLWLYVCTSSEMARKISAAHPNATVLGANGVVYWSYKDGNPAMVGIKTWKGDINNSGVYIAYKNGTEIFRLPEIRTIIFPKKN